MRRHLADGLVRELGHKVAWVQKMEKEGRSQYHTRFLSAEGCYSHVAAHAKVTPGTRVLPFPIPPAWSLTPDNPAIAWCPWRASSGAPPVDA